MRYAGFWIRVWASLVDSFVSVLVIVPLIALAKLGWSSEYNEPAAALIGFVASCVIGWLYYAMFESGSWQATPGKRLLGIRVTDMNGSRISFGRASGRYFGKIISALVFYIGFIMVGITDKKQGLHDKLSETLVLRGDGSDESPLDTLNPMMVSGEEQTFYVPQSSVKRWVMSGFNANGHVVRLTFRQDSPLLRGDGLLVGRDSNSCNLHLDDPSVSRRHLKLFEENGTLMLEDLGSSNGTLVNGRSVQAGMPVELPLQGSVTLGAVELSIAKY
jgi:uncharacterized RDD family membrane protein YckC